MSSKSNVASIAPAPVIASAVMGTADQNVKMTVNGTKLTIEVDLSKDFGLSGSGKSRIIASTLGNISIPGSNAKLGLNIYTKV